MGAPEQIEFRVDDDATVEAVTARLRELASSRRGWVNVEPEVDPDYDRPPRSPLAALLTARGPEAPLATWKPGEVRRHGAAPTSIGVQHAAGTKAAARLAADGIPVPAGWQVAQDHPRRGLVVLVPDDADAGEVLRWLLAAATALSTVPLTGWWRATIYAN